MSRQLHDNDTVADITKLSPIPIVLDMITGTDDKDNEEEDDDIDSEDDTPLESSLYRQMYHTLNETVYIQFADEIKAALEVEMDPEIPSDDTPWRNPMTQAPSSLQQRLAREFDLNARGLKTFGWYSAVLMVYALYGGSESDSSLLLLGAIPAMWLSKLRQLRLLSKMLTYFALPLAVEYDILMPFLPAPLQ
eukprot:gene27900-34684_t